MVDTLERTRHQGAQEVAVAKKSKITTATIRVAADVARMLSQAANNLNVDVAELVDGVLRPFAVEKFRELAKRIQKEAQQLDKS